MLSIVTHTLWRGDTLLGRASLDPAPAGGLTGPFEAEPSFEDVRPLMQRVQDLTRAVGATLTALPPGSSAAEIRDHLTAQPFATELPQVMNALQALGLVLRDAEDNLVPTSQLIVGIWIVPVPEGVTPGERTAMDEELSSMGLGMSFTSPCYVLTARPPKDAPRPGAGGNTP